MATRYTVPKHILRAASRLNAQYLADYREYLAAIEEDYRNGYRASHCEHGTNNWTDYDNICGGCEGGITMSDGMQRMTRAISEARHRTATAEEMYRTANIMRRNGIEYDREAYNATMRRLFIV